MRAALAGGAVARGGGFDEGLAGVERAQLVQHAVVGGDDELRGVHGARGPPAGSPRRAKMLVMPASL